MLRTLTCILLVLSGFLQKADAQSSAEKACLDILDRQTKAWNRGDLEGFMDGYWVSDSLMYIGKAGVTYGYAATLQRYRQNYGDTARMGKLTFRILHVRRLSQKYIQVVGQWSLKRSAGDVGGHYTLLFRRMAGRWVIVSDHSS